MCLLLLAVAQSPFDSSAIHYVIPVFWLTLCFHIIGLMAEGRQSMQLAYMALNSL